MHAEYMGTSAALCLACKVLGKGYVLGSKVRFGVLLTLKTLKC